MTTPSTNARAARLLSQTAAGLGLTMLVYPHQTGGGPSNPEKGANWVGNIHSFWMNSYDHGSSVDSLLHLQYHKVSRTGIRFAVALSGQTALEEMRTIRARKGDMNLDPYRIIIGCGPQYAAIATSSDWDQLKREYKVLHQLGQEFLAEYGDAAVQCFISWVIQQKMSALASEINLSPEEQARLFYELVNLNGMSPTQLANLERGYYATWKNGSGPTAKIAEVMTFACSWAVEETIRKFQNRRMSDQWNRSEFQEHIDGLKARVDNNAPATPATGAGTSKSVAAALDSVPTAMSLTSPEEHPVLGVYFRMIKIGVAKVAVEAKMRSEGYDPSLLDIPVADICLLGRDDFLVHAPGFAHDNNKPSTSSSTAIEQVNTTASMREFQDLIVEAFRVSS